MLWGPKASVGRLPLSLFTSGRPGSKLPLGVKGQIVWPVVPAFLGRILFITHSNLVCDKLCLWKEGRGCWVD